MSAAGMNLSPRISFSNDLSQKDDLIPVEKYIQSNSSSTADFDFCVFRESFDQESSLADELFLDGKILPVEIKKRLAAPPKTAAEPPLSPPPPPPPPPQHDHKIDSTPKKKNIVNSEHKQNSKSFWRSKRSTSLNCGGSYGRSLCSLPLLSRSNSTDSATSTSSKRSSISKYSFNLKQQQKSSLFGNSTKQSQSAPSVSHQKPPLKKNNQGSYGIYPVLNVPTASIFGMASIFSGGKDKNKSKK
ncbi:hypothetical protein Adt_20003 [Abeliophyllum distichum]|uniref:Uncharacterized protein n=1 Tax=Abeliophyllum distichum TaxID=126358 RepID=A0ABD1SVP7_9LAMI